MYTYSIHINILYRIHSVYVQVSNRKPAFVTGTQTNLYRHLDVMQHPRLQLLKWHQRSFKTKLANKNPSKKKQQHTYHSAKRYKHIKHIILPTSLFPSLRAFMLPCTEAAEAEVTPEREAWNAEVKGSKKIG